MRKRKFHGWAFEPIQIQPEAMPFLSGLQATLLTEGIPKGGIAEVGRRHGIKPSAVLSLWRKGRLKLDRFNRKLGMDPHQSHDSLELPLRVSMALKSIGIYTIDQLIHTQPWKLLKAKNFGRKALKEIKEALYVFGLELPPNDDARYPQDDQPSLNMLHSRAKQAREAIRKASERLKRIEEEINVRVDKEREK